MKKLATVRKLIRKLGYMAAEIFCACLLISETVSAAPAPETVDGHVIAAYQGAMVAAASANVRSGPAKSYQIVGVLEKGQVVNVCGQADTGWYQVVYGNGIAYISNKLLTPVPVDEGTLATLAAQAAFVKQNLAAQAAAAQAQAEAQAAQAQAAAAAQAQTEAAAQAQAAAAQAQAAAAAQGIVQGSGNVIFVGDSRVGQMANAVGGSAAYPGVAFVSCYGGGNEWLSTKTAKEEIDRYVVPGSVIILNYGVNDLSKHNEYIQTINKYSQDWQSKGAAVCFASVGPVGENQYGKRNWAVEYFNNQLNGRLSGGIGRIDLYGYLTLTGYTVVPDGLHYTADTYARMFQYLMQSVGKL